MNSKKEFYELVSSVKREGINDLIEWIERTDFFEAPASTRYHGAVDGGLLNHSVSVCKTAININEALNLQQPVESIVIVSLFHDLCKIGCYKRDTKNEKDQNGVWHKVPCFKFDEDFSFGGHGSKSMYLAHNFIKLEPSEAAAINSHMGQYESTQYSNISSVYSGNTLAWLLHVADEASSYGISDKYLGVHNEQ